MSYITILSLIVLIVCIIVGAFKGIVQALLKLLIAGGTSLITVLLTPPIANSLNESAFKDKNVHPGIVSGVSALIVAIVCIVVFSIIAWLINKRVEKSPLGPANRVFGALLYGFIGLVFLILIGYVINIFRDTEAMKSVIENSEKDAFSRWLVSNNLFNSFMEALAKEGGVFDKFINGFKGDSASGDVQQTARIIGSLIGV